MRSTFFSIFSKKIEKKWKKGAIHSILSNRVTFFSLFSTLRTHFEFFSERKSIITKKKSRFIVCVCFAILTQVSTYKHNAYYLQIWAPKLKKGVSQLFLVLLSDLDSMRCVYILTSQNRKTKNTHTMKRHFFFCDHRFSFSKNFFFQIFFEKTFF